MNKKSMSKKSILTGFLISIGLVTGSFALKHAQDNNVAEVSLTNDPKMDYLTLDSNNPVIHRKLTVGEGTLSMLLQTAHDENVTFTLLDPSGKTVSAANIGSRGTFTTEKTPEGKFAQRVELNNPKVGVWKAQYTLKGQNAGYAILESTTYDPNPLGAEVMVDYGQVEGRPVTLSVAVLKGEKAVTDAEVKLVLTNWKTRQETTVIAKDNGDREAGDAKAGDGLYSVTVNDLPPNFFLASAYVNALGEEFMTSSFFAVYEKTAFLTGEVSDDAVDDDGDGQLDRIMLHFPVAWVEREGRYSLNVDLRGSNGKEVEADGGLSVLKPGATTFDVPFSAKEIREKIGVDGPYQVVGVLFHLVPEDSSYPISSHIIQDLGDLTMTKPYKLSQLDNIAFQTGRYLGDKGIDTNGNGLFDQIKVDFEIISTIDAPLTWNAALEPLAGLDMDARFPFAVGKGNVHVGVNKLSLTFDVGEYGLNNVSGPFTLRNLDLNHPDGPQAWPAPFDRKPMFENPMHFGKTAEYSSRQLENGFRALSLDELMTFVASVPLKNTPAIKKTHRSEWLHKLSETKRLTTTLPATAAMHLDSLTYQVSHERMVFVKDDDADLILKSIAEIRRSYPVLKRRGR